MKTATIRRETKIYNGRRIIYVDTNDGEVTAIDPLEAAGVYRFRLRDWNELPSGFVLRASVT